MQLSSYQEAIMAWFRNPDGNLQVEAVAGSGKTTTMEMGVKQPECGHLNILMTAFNKHIAEALTPRLPYNASACTMNSYGFRVCRDNIRGRVHIDGDKTEKILKWDIFNFKNAADADKKRFYKMRGAILKITSLLKGHLFLSKAIDQRFVLELMDKFSIEMPDDNAFWDILQAVWLKDLSETNRLDFDDQIFRPIYDDMRIVPADLVVVDEAQDLNKAKAELFRRMVGSRGRGVAVGDTYQAIYGFSGADHDSMSNLAALLTMRKLPLSICYRCPKAVIRAAQQYVPHIEWGPDAAEGTVANIAQKEFAPQDNDHVLCRTTAPVVQQCLRMIAAGRRATVMGREIGQNLISTIDSIAGTRFQPLEAFDEGLQEYHARKAEALRGRESKLAALEDTVATLDAISEYVATRGEKLVQGLIDQINRVFSETAGGVTFSTIHKAKGLQAKNVYVLRPDLLPHPAAQKEWEEQQERNLAYVAITRAQETLTWVHE